MTRARTLSKIGSDPAIFPGNVNITGVATATTFSGAVNASGISTVGVLTAYSAISADGGIDFSGAQTNLAGMSSETLDAYEEGIHTTVLADSGTGTITVNTSDDQLSYVKVGNLVTVIGRPIITSVSSPTGYLTMTLPFTSADIADASGRSAGSLNLRLVDSGYDVGLFSAALDENSSTLTIYYGGSTDFAWSGPAMKAGTQIWISITYRTT